MSTNSGLPNITCPESAGEEALFAAAQNAVAEWDRREPLLSVLMKHSDADALSGLFLQLRFYLDARDAAGCREALLRCSAQVRVLIAGERFSWENILHRNGKIFIKKLYF